jgi:steroid 5-alpha reductase family enzyme
MDSITSVLTLNLALACAIMFAVWVVSIRLKDVSIIDIAWGATGAALAVSTYFLAGGTPERKLLVTGMTVIWGGRLAIHIARRKKGKGEDFRYAAMRARSPETFPLQSLITVFMLQAFLIWLISMPAQLAQLRMTPSSLTFLDLAGLVLWGVGMAMEALADHQLSRFLADESNQGKVMDQGLWRYSRHPNYFGDSLVWWGIYLVAAATPGGWVTIFSPVLMTWFLLRVSGVPMLEDALADRRTGYREYMQQTSPFFPWPPRKDDS